MPEYSSTTITPADNVQVPSMDGSTPGNFALSALRSYILASKGQANGLAGLGADGKLDPNQIPDSLDDVLVYATRSNFPATGEAGKIYITADNNKLYRWDSNVSDYVVLSVDLSAYATKAEVNALSARVSNLEQTTKQDEQTVQYPDDGNFSSIMPNGVPASVADYGEVTNIRGKSRGWGNLCHSVATTTTNGVTFTNNGDGSYTLNGTAGTDGAYIILFPDSDRIQTHSYMAWDDNNSNLAYGFSLNGSNRRTIFHAGYGFNALLFVDEGVTVSNVVVHPILRDLTAIFGQGNEPLTTADAIRAIPDIVKNEDFTGYSLVNATVTGVKAIGRNLIDWSAITADAFVRSADGEVQSYGSGDVNATDYIPVVGGSSYFLGGFTSINYGNSGAVYDINKNFIVAINHYNDLQPITIPANGAYVRLSLWLANFSDAENSAYFTLNSNPHAFTPYKTDTLSLSSPVTLRSAGAVSEVLTLETGKKTRPVGDINLGIQTWSYSAGIFIANCTSGISGRGANLTCSKYINAGYVSSAEMGNKTIQFLTDQIWIRDDSYNSVGSASDPSTFLGQLQNVHAYVPLATPLADEQVCDPIPDNFVKVQAGGTIETIQTQTPVIDNCLDVAYDFIPA